MLSKRMPTIRESSISRSSLVSFARRFGFCSASSLLAATCCIVIVVLNVAVKVQVTSSFADSAINTLAPPSVVSPVGSTQDVVTL